MSFPETYIETPLELSDGRILLIRTDRDFIPDDGVRVYDADIMTKAEYHERLCKHS
jgi:hypothetical protein